MRAARPAFVTRPFPGLICLAALIWAGLAHALAPPEVSEDVSVFRYGFYCDPGSIAENEAPDTVTGTTGVWQDRPEFHLLGPSGPAVIGTGFGVMVQVDPRMEGPVTIVVEHPPHGENAITRESWQTEFSSQTPTMNGFSFDHDYELTPGLWTMSASRAGRVIYRVQFEILPATPGLSADSFCEGPVTIS